MPVTLTLHRRSDFVQRLTVHDHAVGRAAKAKSIKSAQCKKTIDPWFSSKAISKLNTQPRANSSCKATGVTQVDK